MEALRGHQTGLGETESGRLVLSAERKGGRGFLDSSEVRDSWG